MNGNVPARVLLHWLCDHAGAFASAISEIPFYLSVSSGVNLSMRNGCLMHSSVLRDLKWGKVPSMPNFR